MLPVNNPQGFCSALLKSEREIRNLRSHHDIETHRPATEAQRELVTTGDTYSFSYGFQLHHFLHLGTGRCSALHHKT